MRSRRCVVRLPERRLVDPIGLLQHALAEAKSLEHLHGAAGDAVGLAEQQRAGLLLDDAGLDVGKGRQLRRQRQTGRAAADDQDVDLVGQSVRTPDGRIRSAGSEISGSPGSKPLRWNCMNQSSSVPGQYSVLS